MLKQGDIVIQTVNDGIWWILARPRPFEDQFGAMTVLGVCVVPPREDGWSAGERCEFDTDPLNGGVVIIGCSRTKPARATCLTLAALAGHPC